MPDYLDYNIHMGFELEAFLSPIEADNHKLNIENVQKLLSNRFGTNNVEINFNKHIVLTDDGTVLEGRNIGSSCDLQRSPITDIRHIQESMTSLSKMLGKEIMFEPFLRNGGWHNGKKINFLNPGNRFSSEKYLFNAYASTVSQDPKKDDGVVSFRTAGFHIHFDFPPEISKALFVDVPTGRWNDKIKHSLNYFISYKRKQKNVFCDTLIKIIDKVTDNVVVPHMSYNDKQREELYSTLGDYRIQPADKTHCKQPTLEYRRLNARFVTLEPEIIETFFSEMSKEILFFIRSVVVPSIK